MQEDKVEDVPEEAQLEAQKSEEMIAARSDTEAILDAVIQLTKEVGKVQAKLQEFYDEWDLARRAGKF